MRLSIRLRLIPTAEGGRRRPVATGYRASWDIGDQMPNGSVHFHDAPLVMLTRSPLQPGEEADAEIEVALPEFWADVPAGAQITMQEGSRVVGTAIVVRSAS